MSVARVTMHEYIGENMHKKFDALYQTVRKKYFPTIEQTINIKTGPTSVSLFSFIRLLRMQLQTSKAVEK